MKPLEPISPRLRMALGIIFFILIGIVIVLSVILSWIGWSATYEAIDPVTHEIVTQTTTFLESCRLCKKKSLFRILH